MPQKIENMERKRTKWTHLAEALLALELHTTLIDLVLHLWQDSFLLQPLADHRFYLQSTTHSWKATHPLIYPMDRLLKGWGGAEHKGKQ